MDVAVFVINENKHEIFELKIQLYELGLTQIGCYCEFGVIFTNVWRIQ
jgi:hypothetical protein